jgi:cofilin
LKKDPWKLRFFIYKVTADGKSIEIEKTGPITDSYNDLVVNLPEAECRYALVDLEFNTEDGRPTSKLVFFTWTPDISPVRQKMIYSGSKEALKRALVGVGIHMNATDAEELDLEATVLPTVRKFA